ncbi:MAG TPA: RPA12/RPB9/RPC11 RNA polymerase family protein [Candidatus Lokiarchaeia archaeon]|nr:RPA12/RPB9/RPC11 RNA polymerase family protein [Candidatus Lokiarchaeia archaeon]
MVDFCPNCGSILYPRKKGEQKVLFCKMCDYEKELEGKAAPLMSPVVADHTLDKTLVKDDKYWKSILGDKASSDKTPDCPRCGAKMQMTVRQTRRADEGPTIFYTCIKCNKQIRIGS